ncbi:outer membrane beta-barrel family protein [Chitinophaga ginsengisoli]|uniref:Carboxypeptidase family protein n=1 Tax=Chitinophaga ginsengisoli TaxID=363837 RepID=A0A2P8GKG5_9BACT|nr:outer membrane beta-barrel family protein [Chitinophaga ginsengisoli]PSL34451.1 carboxypeptidase family protein [Chitinophaga ginsengisoli]
MLKITATILFSFIFYSTYAQVSVRGKITDNNQHPMAFATISVQQGNIVVYNTFTDSTGHYRFPDIKTGNYKFLIRPGAFRDTSISLVIHADTTLNIQYDKVQMLSEVIVRSKKPVFERTIDRLRFNVAGTDLVYGNNIWDVVEKTPLINASSDGTLEIAGTSGAIVYINNKKKILSGNALKNYLSSIPSDNLEAIEVMTTPPSKYDAEGGAGIINIIIKKNKEEGLNGNAVLSTRQSAVNSQAASVYLNHRKGKWNIYTDIYAGNRKRKPEFNKNIYYPSNGTDSLAQRHINSSNEFRVLYPGASLGADYQLNRNHVIGLLFDFSGDWHKETRDAYSRDYYPHADSLRFTNNNDDLNSQTYALNFNYQGKLDSTGTTLSVDVDVLEYRSGNKSLSKTQTLDTDTYKPLLTKDWFRSSSPQDISNKSVKADLEWPIGKKASLDLGAKISLSSIHNDLVFENWTPDYTWEKDFTRSNLFRYDENVSSLYAIWNSEINARWSYQLGMRVENTVAKGWLNGSKVVNRNYTNVFPTAFLKYTTAKERTYVLAVSSRITRPGFWDVNPFRMYTTDQTYFEGNPFLMPSKYYRQELSHTLEGKTGTYTFQLAASQLLDEFYALPYNPSGNIIANKKTNYGNKYSYSGAMVYYNKLLPWWTLSGSLLTGYVISRGKYADSVDINNESFLLSLSANQTFTISKKRGLSCTVIAKNTFPVTIVNTKISNRLETEIRLRKSIQNFNIVLSAQDLFKSNMDRYNIMLDGLRIIDKNYHDTRSVALSVSYNFGKSTVKSKRDRDTGNDDVKGRIM